MSFSIKRLLIALGCSAIPLTAVHQAQASEQPTDAVATKLIEAENALSHKQFPKAVQSAIAAQKDAKTETDRYLTLQTLSAIYTSSGDFKNAVEIDNELARSPLASSPEKLKYLEGVVGLAFKIKDYPACQSAALQSLAIKYQPLMATMAAQCPYLAQNWEITTASVAHIAKFADDAHAKIPENVLQMDAFAQGKIGDKDAQQADYFRLARLYPSQTYWKLVLHAADTLGKLPPRLVFVLQRFKFEVGALPQSDTRDMIERALQMDLPLLAERLERKSLGDNRVLSADERRFADFVAERAKAARAALAQTVKQAEADSQAGPSLNAGYNLVLAGQVDQGLALMKQGLSKRPKHLDQAQLSYALAEFDAGLLPQAERDLATVSGSGDAKRLADLWSVLVASKTSQND